LRKFGVLVGSWELGVLRLPPRPAEAPVRPVERRRGRGWTRGGLEGWRVELNGTKGNDEQKIDPVLRPIEAGIFLG
jgi:hypothetical protein